MSFRKKIPITGSFGKGKDQATSVEAVKTDEVVQEPSPISTAQNNKPPLASVFKEDVGSMEVPKEVEKKTNRFSRVKKIALYMVFLILLISVISFTLTVVRTIRNRGNQTDLNDKSGEIVWWGLEDPRVYQDVISLYQQLNPQAKVVYVKQPTNQYVRKLENAIRNGNAPDMFSFHNSWSKSYAKQLSSIPTDVFSAEEFEKSYYPVIVEDLATEGGIVGLPLMYDGLTLYINEDIFSASGRDEPTRWDELKPLATDLTQKGSNGLILQSGIALGITENVDHWQEVIAILMFQNNVDPTNPVGPDAQVVFDYYNSFALARVWDDSFPLSTIAFSQGDSAMLFGTGKAARDISITEPKVNFKSIGLPQVRKDDRLSPDIGYASYWVEGVWSGSSEKGLAFDFLRFISDPVNLQKISEKSEEVYGVATIFPRPDMSELQINDPVLGSIVALAPLSKSWFLADKTYDEPDGINAQISAIYKEMLDSSGSLGAVDQLANELVTSLNQVINFLTNPLE